MVNHHVKQKTAKSCTRRIFGICFEKMIYNVDLAARYSCQFLYGILKESLKWNKIYGKAIFSAKQLFKDKIHCQQQQQLDKTVLHLIDFQERGSIYWNMKTQWHLQTECQWSKLSFSYKQQALSVVRHNTLCLTVPTVIKCRDTPNNWRW